MLLLVRMKNTSAMPGFLSTSYLGEVVGDKGGKVELKNTCVVLETIAVDKEGNRDIKLNFMTNSMTTNGTLAINEDEIWGAREVAPGDEFLKSYDESLEAFAESKSRIKKATAMPISPINPSARN